MESIPHMPMLIVPWKSSPVSPDISSLKKKIRARYGDQVHIDEQLFQSFLKLRSIGCKTCIDNVSVSHLKRYYAHIMLLKNRIDFNTPKLVEWPWQDAFKENQFSRSEVEYEEAAILYNLGAALSFLGQQENRFDADSMKVACVNFQSAAWIFQSLRERYSQFDDAKDMHNDLLRFYSVVMLNQAQECITEKSILDKQSPIITARLMKHLSESYNYCQTLLDAELMKELVPMRTLKDWKRRISIKRCVHGALSNYYAGMSAESDMKFGISVAWQKLAEENITEAWKLARDFNDSTDQLVGPRLIDITRLTRDLIVKSHKRAAEDNRTIYHESVPSTSELEQLKSVCLAKATPFDHTDPKIVGEDIFKDLLPIETLEASSVYSEMKANYLRSILNEVEEKDVDLESFLSTINLDPKYILQADESLPQPLLDACAKLSAMDPLPEAKLSSKMSALVDASVDVESEVAEFGSSLTSLLEDLRKLKDVEHLEKDLSELEKKHLSISGQYESLSVAVATAKKSNSQLRQALMENLTSVKILLRPVEEIENGLTKVAPLQNDDQLKLCLNEVARILEKVEVMRNQRSSLVAALRVSLQSDDPTRELLTTQSADHNKLFATQLANHDPAVAIIRQNLAAQDNISKALVELNAKVAIKKHAIFEQRERRQEQMEKLIQSSENLDELLQKCDEGENFYKQISGRLQELRVQLTELTNSIGVIKPRVVIPPFQTSPKSNLDHSPSNFPRLGDYLKARSKINQSPHQSAPLVQEAQIPYGQLQQPFPMNYGQQQQYPSFPIFPQIPPSTNSGGNYQTNVRPPGIFQPMGVDNRFQTGMMNPGANLSLSQQNQVTSNPPFQQQSLGPFIQPVYSQQSDSRIQPNFSPSLMMVTNDLRNTAPAGHMQPALSTSMKPPYLPSQAVTINPNYYPSQYSPQKQTTSNQYIPLGVQQPTRPILVNQPFVSQQNIFSQTASNQFVAGANTKDLELSKQISGSIPVGQYAYPYPRSTVPNKSVIDSQITGFDKPAVSSPENYLSYPIVGQTTHHLPQTYTNVSGNVAHNLTQYSVTSRPSSDSKHLVRQLPPDFQMFRVSTPVESQQQKQQSNTDRFGLVPQQRPIAPTDNILKPVCSVAAQPAPSVMVIPELHTQPDLLNDVYLQDQYNQPMVSPSMIGPSPPTIDTFPVRVTADSQTTPTPTFNQNPPESSFSNLTISPHVITETMQKTGSSGEKDDSGNTLPFSDLSGRLVDLSLDDDQGALGRRRYRPRDFIDKDWRESRDQQHSSSQNLFADLDALNFRSQNNVQ